MVRKTKKKKTISPLFKTKPIESKRVTKFILDPVYNLKEAAIQLILLEDHLNFSEKLCIDCIMKHIYSYRGFTTEALTLNGGKKYKKIICPLIEFSKELERNVAKHTKHPDRLDGNKLAQKIRLFRKPLVTTTFGKCI